MQRGVYIRTASSRCPPLTGWPASARKVLTRPTAGNTTPPPPPPTHTHTLSQDTVKTQMVAIIWSEAAGLWPPWRRRGSARAAGSARSAGLCPRWWRESADCRCRASRGLWPGPSAGARFRTGGWTAGCRPSAATGRRHPPARQTDNNNEL